MKRAFQITALILLAGALFTWFALGANRGWTQTSVPVKTVDEITGIEGITYTKKFVPGIEILGGALLGAALLAGASFLIRTKSYNK